MRRPAFVYQVQCVPVSVVKSDLVVDDALDLERCTSP
jgi:hypothetical protein